MPPLQKKPLSFLSISLLSSVKFNERQQRIKVINEATSKDLLITNFWREKSKFSLKLLKFRAEVYFI
jgi:hypothetical protein